MAGSRVPAALRDRLGDEATFGLIELLDGERNEWREQVLSVAADRFERRLTEEVSGLRVEFRTALHDGLAHLRDDMHDGLARLRNDMHDGLARLRDDMHDGLAHVRDDMHGGLASVRQQLHDGMNALRQEVATTRVEMLKWSFLFWIGQVAAMAGLLALMFRITGR
jgi:hypothetical protein